MNEKENEEFIAEQMDKANICPSDLGMDNIKFRICVSTANCKECWRAAIKLQKDKNKGGLDGQKISYK